MDKATATDYAAFAPLVLRHADTAPAQQKVVWLEQHALTSYLGGLVQACVHSYRDAITLRRQLGDRLGEGDDLRRLSHVLSRLSAARETGQESLRLLEQCGPTPQLAWSLTHMAELSWLAYDPACSDYAARAITLGNKLDLPGVVFSARFYAALFTVVRTGVGWDELEAGWRDAMGVPEFAELAGRHCQDADADIGESLPEFRIGLDVVRPVGTVLAQRAQHAAATKEVDAQEWMDKVLPGWQNRGGRRAR